MKVARGNVNSLQILRPLNASHLQRRNGNYLGPVSTAFVCTATRVVIIRMIFPRVKPVSLVISMNVSAILEVQTNRKSEIQNQHRRDIERNNKNTCGKSSERGDRREQITIYGSFAIRHECVEAFARRRESTDFKDKMCTGREEEYPIITRR